MAAAAAEKEEEEERAATATAKAPSTPFAEALAVGALAPGVNSATLAALNSAFVAAALSLAGLLCLLLSADKLSSPSDRDAARARAALVVPHAAVALVLTVLLGVAVNFLVSATGGVVGVEEQKRALFGDQDKREEEEEKKEE